MAPFRSTARSNRSGRGLAEQDVFAGLPVRQWRQTEGTFGLPPPEILQQDKDLIFPELPMPRDTNQLALHTQLLLREARKPRSTKRKATEPRVEIKPDEDEENREHHLSRGWNGKKWSQVPANLEEPDPEYLAKRRKGLASTYVEAPAFVPQIATRTAKVKKFDDAGQQIVYEVIVPEGQTIEGEVKDEDVSMLEAPALPPGTVIEGVGVANAEGQIVANNLLQPGASKRKKPPPPKRKGGPGRGRKKVMFQRPAITDEAGTGTGAATPTTIADGGTPSASIANGEEEGEEGEEGEDGEEGDEDDRDDGDLVDAEGPEPHEPDAILPPTDGALTSDAAIADTAATDVPITEPIQPPSIPAVTSESGEPVPALGETVAASSDAAPPSTLVNTLDSMQKDAQELAGPSEPQSILGIPAENTSTEPMETEFIATDTGIEGADHAQDPVAPEVVDDASAVSSALSAVDPDPATGDEADGTEEASGPRPAEV